MKPHERRMQFLARLIKAERLEYIVELGVRDGQTYFHLLEKCPGIKLVGIDIWDKIPYRDAKDDLRLWPHSENERKVREQAKRYGARAMLFKGLTDDLCDNFHNDSVDLIFIDADHTYAAVKNDIINWRPKLRSGGFLTGHDIHWPEVRDAVDELVIHYEVGPDNVWYTKVR